MKLTEGEDVPAGAAPIAPIAELIAELKKESEAWDGPHTHTGPWIAKLLRRAADALAAMEMERDKYKVMCDAGQKKAEAQLERQIVQSNLDAARFRECLAENAALRELMRKILSMVGHIHTTKEMADGCEKCQLVDDAVAAIDAARQK